MRAVPGVVVSGRRRQHARSDRMTYNVNFLWISG